MSGAGARAPRACGVRARARTRAVPPRFSRGGVCPEGLGAPLRAPPPPAPRERRLSPARSRSGLAAGGWRAGAGRGRLASGGASLGRGSGMDRTDGGWRRAPAAGVPWVRTPAACVVGGAWLVGRLAKGAEAGWRRGRRGTALVLVAVGSRACLPGGPARVSVGAPFPEPVPSSARARALWSSLRACAPSPQPPAHLPFCAAFFFPPSRLGRPSARPPLLLSLPRHRVGPETRPRRLSGARPPLGPPRLLGGRVPGGVLSAPLA